MRVPDVPTAPTSFRFVLRGLQVLAVLGVLAALAPVRAERTPPPRADYKQALKYSAKNLAPLTYSTTVIPGWVGKTDSFWYSYRTSAGVAYWLVDPVRKSKTPLFDREKLTGQLAEITRKPIDATLPITRGQVSDDGRKFSFVFADILYEYDLKAEKLVSTGKPPPPQRFPGGTPGFGRRRGGADDLEEAQ